MVHKKEKQEIDLNLRKFIKDLGCMAGGAAVLASTPWLQSFTTDKKTETQKEKARIAIIGTGSRGQYHMHNLLAIKNAELVALCDDYLPNLKNASAICPKAKTYTNYKKLLESPDIDGVIIASPLNWHAPMTMDALSAGKHVFCEKAMALTMDECKAMYDVYQRSDRVLYFCLQQMFDEKYIKGIKMIQDGLVGDIVGFRCHWFRNHDWRRPVPSPELEKRINWRLYWETSGGLITELGSHQLEICNWTMDRIPTSVSGMGDIVHWKDGREVYDSINLIYKYANGVKINYESLISNKFNGMENQVIGHKGSVELAQGLFYLEDDNSSPGIQQLIGEIQEKIFTAIPVAGPSWRSETKLEYKPHAILKGKTSINTGASMVSSDADGSDLILSSFVQACITGEKAKNIVEEAYAATIVCLLGNQAIKEGRTIEFPEKYKIPYMKF